MKILHISQLKKAQIVKLPKLPVPALEQTLTKYEKTMQPLLNEAERERLRQVIQNFGGSGGLGPKLQLYLLEQQKKLDNWAYNYWLKDMYLGNQAALPVNSNPGMVFPPRKFTTVLDVARFTARLIEAALDYKTILDRRSLPIDRAQSQPLCMAQYYRILGSCRIPGTKIDSQYLPETPTNNSQPAAHVIILCRNIFYCVPVQAADRGRLNEDEICSQLLYILDNAPNLSNTIPVGLLTGCKRPHWAEIREVLKRDSKNSRNLDLIEKSLLVVCLDEPLPTSFNNRLTKGGLTAGSRDETNIALQMLHGGGIKYNSANRWFDKTIQLIVSGDGACGMNYEHSAAEGLAPIQMIEKMLKQVNSLPLNSDVPSTSASHLPQPERLEWNIEPEEQKKIADIGASLDNLIRDLDHFVYRYTGYGKDFIKSCKVSPDAYIQLALQLAYYKLQGKLTATYESASTRRFLYGRVDCIRSASPEALDWARAMTQPKEGDDMGNKKVTFHLVSDEVKFQLWDKVIKQQVTEMTDNIMGQGIDIHLLGLREAAKETSPHAAHPLPEIFTDTSYKIANKFLLSTSQVPTSMDSFMGYGPVEQDGYGASYNPKPDAIIFCLSAFWSSELTSTSKFAQSLEESLNTMQALMLKRKEI